MMSQVTGRVTAGCCASACTRWSSNTSRCCGCRPIRSGSGSFALLAYDFCYYWLHRAGHRVAVLWAAHAVHHQSEDYNLSTALRQTSSGFLLGWLFYLPMAVLGVPPLVFGVVALIDLLYQYWVHTQQIGRLGWFDRWFCSPSNHRVHHAVNDRYLDSNYGGILIVWDRLFGSFVEEDDAEPCVYGTRAPLRSWNPLWANLQVYRDLARDSWRARSWADKLRVWLKPPGWRPADVAARWPKPAFDINAVQRFDPPASRGALALAARCSRPCWPATSALLWHAHRLDARRAGAGCGGDRRRVVAGRRADPAAHRAAHDRGGGRMSAPRTRTAARCPAPSSARTTPASATPRCATSRCTVGAGEFVSVVGPTGCGKSTLAERRPPACWRPAPARCTVFGEPLDGINARAGYMFQTESLMPWRTALGNVMAGLEFRGVRRCARRRPRTG